MGGTWRKVAVGAVVVALLAFFMLACGGSVKTYETDKANKSIDLANSFLDDYNNLQAEINKSWDRVDAMPADIPGMQQRKTVLLEIQKQIVEQASLLDKMITEYENARKLYISADMKTYFQMLIDHTKKQKEVNAIFQTGTANRIKLADDIIAGGDALALATASDAEVDALNKQAEKLQADAKALKDKADKFHVDKNLSGNQ
ncbi:MAG: hypothetical protein WC891_02740 [Actinomycetota bacterium]